MQLSEGGKKVLGEREGLELEAYLDKVARPPVWTIGLGHTSAAGPPKVVKGMKISEAEAWEIFHRDCETFRKELEGVIKVPLKQHQEDALVSFIHNIGARNFKRSTVLKRLNAGDTDGANEAMLMWMNPPQLRSRRYGEYWQFQDGRLHARADHTGKAVA